MVNYVDPVNIIDFLFQEVVLNLDDMTTLRKIKDDPKRQCSELLTLLHRSKNQQAFVKLYAAIQRESEIQWLIDSIDNVSRQEIVHLVQLRYISDESGEP